MKKEFHSKHIYNKIVLKTKIKSHGDDVTDFYDKETPKVDSNNTSVLKKGENYYCQVLLKDCKYIKQIVIRYITDNSSDFSFDDDESDEE